MGVPAVATLPPLKDVMKKHKTHVTAQTEKGQGQSNILKEWGNNNRDLTIVELPNLLLSGIKIEDLRCRECVFHTPVTDIEFLAIVQAKSDDSPFVCAQQEAFYYNPIEPAHAKPISCRGVSWSLRKYKLWRAQHNISKLK